jgi:hypothetical protein
MPIQYSTALRNNQLNQIESTAGTSARLRLYSGSPPANCAATASGLMLVDMALPSDWMGDAASGQKSKTGTWSGAGTAAAAAGTNAGYFRITNSDGDTTHMQGTVTISGGGGDMTLDNTNIAQNQVVTVNTFSVTAGNA